MNDKQKETLVIERIKVQDGWLEVYIKDRFEGKPMYVQAKFLTDKIESMLR
jgi:hypothetical protein